MRLLLTAAATVTALLATSAPALASVTGPDVASYQHPSGARINWAKVKKSGRDFAIVKATEGTSYTNPYFAGDWSGIANAGLVRGTYHFARPAMPISTALDQADYFAQAIGNQKNTKNLPPILDLEVTGGLSPGELIIWTQTFLAEVQAQTGRIPMIYSYPAFWRDDMANTDALVAYPLWIADYNGGSAPTSIGGWPTWTLWQYTSSAHQSGIGGGGVDMSRFNGSTTQLRKLADGTAPLNWPVTVPSAPVGLSATPGQNSVTVSWIPGSNGGSPVTSWEVDGSDGSVTKVSATRSSATIDGLQNGQDYTFTVRAINDEGNGALSQATDPVMPAIPTLLHTSVTPTTIGYRKVATMSTVLTRRDTGQPLAGRRIWVYARTHGARTWVHEETLRTDENGAASYTLTGYHNTDLRMKYPGRSGWLPFSSSTRVVHVHPWVSAKLRPSQVAVKHTTKLYGHVSPLAAGDRIYRQGLVGGQWHTYDRTVVGRKGWYFFTVKPTVRTTDTYRTVIRGTSLHARATSPKVTLVVQ